MNSGLIADDAEPVARGKRRARLCAAASLTLLTISTVLVPRLLANLQKHGGIAVDAGQRLGVGHAVLDTRHVAHLHGVTADLTDDDARRTRRATRRGRASAW